MEREQSLWLEQLSFFRILQKYIPHFQHQCLVGTLKKRWNTSLQNP